MALTNKYNHKKAEYQNAYLVISSFSAFTFGVVDGVKKYHVSVNVNIYADSEKDCMLESVSLSSTGGLGQDAFGYLEEKDITYTALYAIIKEKYYHGWQDI
jgi:hypothetical protein